MAGRGGEREGSGPFGEPLADEYGSFLPHKQFSASAVAQLKRRFSPTSSSSSSSSSVTTPPNDPSSHSRSLHKDKVAPLQPSSSSSRGSTSTSTSGDEVAGRSTVVRHSSSSPLKLVQEMVSMPFGSPLVSPLRDGPAGAASPVRPGLEELSTHSPPVAADFTNDSDSPARQRNLHQRRRDGARSPTSSPSRERSPVADAHKRKRESSDRRRASVSEASTTTSRSAGGGDEWSDVKQQVRSKEPDPKRTKREGTSSGDHPRDHDNKERAPTRDRERRDSDPRPSGRDQQPQPQRHKERARGSEKGLPPKDDLGTKDRTRLPTTTTTTKTPTTAPKPSVKPQLSSKGAPQAAKTDQAAPPPIGDAASSFLSNGLKSQANTLKRAADKAMKTDGAHEALGLYIEAGLKYLECCHQLEQEASESNSPLKNAAHMYKRTAKFFDDILKIATHDKDKLRASVCYRGVAIALARAFCLKKESMRHAQKDLQAQLKRVPVLSLPTTPDASCGSPQLPEASPPVSKARPGPAADTLSSAFRQHALSFFEEIDDMFKALDAWQKAESARAEAERSGSAMAAAVFPVALDSFLLQSPAQAPTSQVVDYVRQAINQPASATHRK